jgi:hypothetical protein
MKKNPVFETVGLSLGLGIIGKGLSDVDSTTSSNMISAGSTASSFISPMVNIEMSGKTIKMLKGLKS